MAVANVCYHMRIPVANEKTWKHLLPKYHKFRALKITGHSVLGSYLERQSATGTDRLRLEYKLLTCWPIRLISLASLSSFSCSLARTWSIFFCRASWSCQHIHNSALYLYYYRRRVPGICPQNLTKIYPYGLNSTPIIA